MRVLVFDTCFNKTYITLVDGEKIIENLVIKNTDANYHSVFLIPRIRDILKRNNLFFSDIDVLGVNTGPGSFTGIRAGVTIARVLAQQTNIKLIGVCSLEILSKLNKSSKNTVVILDARKNKMYFARFNNGDAQIEPMLVEKDLLIEKLNENDFIISDSSIGNFLKENCIEFVNYEENDNELGLFLADIVCERLKKGGGDYNWAKVKPLYIQPPSISKPREVKNVQI